MNKKSNSQGYARGYARILDVVAGDQVPQHLNLAPDILTRIEKRKGRPMQRRTRLITAAVLVAILFAVLFYTVPGMAAAVERAIEHWFGYVPGVGLVREGQIRVLAKPVSVTREGVTVTVEQVVINPERTALVYSVEGIPSTSVASNPVDQHCAYKVALRLPDGSPLLASPNGIQYWASGYQHLFYYPPVPSAIKDATLVIDCLFNTRSGSAPENWEIPLRFVPAPPDVTAFPVIEIPTTTAAASSSGTAAASSSGTAAPAATATLAPDTAPGATAEASPQPVSITLTLDRAVQMDDGYLIYATVHWKDTPFASLDITDPTEMLRLLDANGQEMLYEFRYDEQTGVKSDQRQTVFAIKTAPVQVPGPLTLALDSVSANLSVDAKFIFDPGSDPKPGQTWAINQEVKIGRYDLHIHSAKTDGNGYSFEMSSENGILNAVAADLEHPVPAGGGGGGGGNPGERFWSSFNYANGLPKGPVTVTITAIEVRHIQKLQAQWTPPAASVNLLPTQPAACLTKASWKAAISEAASQKPALPEGITGRVLTAGPLDKNNSEKWAVIITSMDGSKRQVIEDAQDGSISPDGAKLAYSTFAKGLTVLDLATNQASPIPGTGNGDFNPMWTPDGKQIVFNRGMGIFDLFLIDPDGSNLRQLTHGGVQEWPVGWLPAGVRQDGAPSWSLLYSVPGRENEHTIYQVDVQTGDSQVFSHDVSQSTSPDGKYIITTENTFGDRWLTYVSELNGSNRWLLADASLWVLTPIWSPDGQWLIAGVSDTDAGAAVGALINLHTCQVIPQPDLHGNFLSWVP